MTRVLVGEDEPGIAMVLEDDLKLEGYDIALAGDGETALARAREGFDLILLDIMLPRKDGLEVCRELRRSGVHTPVLMLTAKTQEAEKILGLELGADDYMTKPYSPRELRARIKALLRRAGTPVERQSYRFGDAELDLTRCELRREGRKVELTPLEFRLLATFARNQGRVFTRAELLDKVWGDQTFVTDRVVDNQITNLRKKIERSPAEPQHLISVRGIGYRFDG